MSVENESISKEVMHRYLYDHIFHANVDLAIFNVKVLLKIQFTEKEIELMIMTAGTAILISEWSRRT